MTEIKRRPSIEIAEDYVELNFKTLIDLDSSRKMSAQELKAKKEAKKQLNRHRRIIYGTVGSIIGLILTVIIIALLWWDSSTKSANIADKGAYQFEVNKGATVDDVAVALKKSGFIRNVLAFKIYARLNGSVLRAGTHMVSPSYPLAEIVSKLTKLDGEIVDVQILPGLSLAEIKESFKKYDYTDREIDEALNTHYDFDILSDKPADATLEGYLYPDTYRVAVGDKLSEVIKKSLNELSKVNKKYKLREGFKSKGLNFHEGLTLASIVTKEVHNKEDQPKVASVFFNRLNNNMNLGSDVTYQYAYNNNLCTQNSPDCDSAFNTRIHKGLPPTPIANPTLTALRAVSEMEKSDYYYFVASDNGKTYYAKTIDEHNSNVANYCGSMCQ